MFATGVPINASPTIEPPKKPSRPEKGLDKVPKGAAGPGSGTYGGAKVAAVFAPAMPAVNEPPPRIKPRRKASVSVGAPSSPNPFKLENNRKIWSSVMAFPRSSGCIGTKSRIGAVP